MNIPADVVFVVDYPDPLQSCCEIVTRFGKDRVEYDATAWRRPVRVANVVFSLFHALFRARFMRWRGGYPALNVHGNAWSIKGLIGKTKRDLKNRTLAIGSELISSRT